MNWTTLDQPLRFRYPWTTSLHHHTGHCSLKAYLWQKIWELFLLNSSPNSHESKYAFHIITPPSMQASFSNQQARVLMSLDSWTTSQYSDTSEETTFLLGNNLLLRHLPSNKSSHRLSSRVIDDLLHPFASRSRAFDVFVCSNSSGLPVRLQKSGTTLESSSTFENSPLKSKCSKSDTPTVQKMRTQSQFDDLPKSTGREDPSSSRRGTAMVQN